MKKMLKRLCTDFLALETVVTALPMNITVRQSRQSGVARATCPD